MKIFVGMSGGVDSAVAALLLKENGEQVTGVFMKNWQDQDDKFCSAEQDFSDVEKVCSHLKIPYYTFNFEDEYLEHVFKLFLESFAQGYTPNPDILCNKEIKFNFFLKQALKSGAEKIATGHYARVRFNEEKQEYELLKGADKNKDQSYFLCLLTQQMLAKTIFPIGEYEKTEVRMIAKKHNLAVHDKKDSTGICFIGERKFNEFLSQFLPAQKGTVVDTEGNELGTHNGTMYYTIGQRKGIGIGGPGDPLFVVDKDVEKNIVVVARGENNPALFHKNLVATNWHWIGSSLPDAPFICTAKIRYRQDDEPVTLTKIENDRYYFEFLNAQRAVTPGQQIVLYNGDVCLGGGTIIGRYN